MAELKLSLKGWALRWGRFQAFREFSACIINQTQEVSTCAAFHKGTYLRQGCQILLGPIVPKIYQMNSNYVNGYKIYQMHFQNGHKIYQRFPFQDPPKYTKIATFG
jgi:hypothetical protein